MSAPESPNTQPHHRSTVPGPIAQLVQTRSELWAILRAWRQQGLDWALVPTMGNLHAGHLSLVKLAQKHAARVIVSIFVNPTQFGPNEDFQRYPRTLANDLAQLKQCGVDAVFAPASAEIYPYGTAQALILHAPRQLSDTLCGLSRPGHFDGVVTVVSRLFNLCQPRWAVFGEKDYQQLLIIEYTSRELGYPVEILRGPTLRESNGLAMSSRNQYLSSTERQCASVIQAQLQDTAKTLSQRHNQTMCPDDYQALEKQAMAQIQQAGLEPEYFHIRDASSLGTPMPYPQNTLRLLAAARLGTTRLIDNVGLP